MTIAEVEKEALVLPEQARARLVASLLTTLPPVDTTISDEEVSKRDAELNTGQTEEISHGEFLRRVERERSR